MEFKKIVMSKKQTYRIRNRKQYNESLVQRGSLTFWIDEEAIQQWNLCERTGERGRPLLYSDTAIQCALLLRAVFHLPLRATEGFLRSLIELAQLGISCPDYTTLCKRQRDLEVTFPKSEHKGPLHIVVDSTGLKVFGEGEWKVRQHGYTKRRTWRKLHLAVDAISQAIEGAVLSTNDFKDSEILPDLLDQIDTEMEQVSGDGGYDRHQVYRNIAERGAKPVIPPRRDSVIAQHGNCKKPPLPRDEVLRGIRKCGRKKWKKQMGYHKRSLAETAMYRVKTIFGNSLRSRIFENQACEALLKCYALNRMTQLGMPDSYKIA